ncbi:MAG: hypothetical protein ABIS20_02475 [Thermoanaerobaculia bacterium]
MKIIQAFRKLSERAPLALLIPGFLFLACRSAPPAPSSPADFTSCPDLAGTYLFEDLATSCALDGPKGVFPTYAFIRNGKLREPRDPVEVLPLPLYHWADPGSRLKVEQQGCGRIELSLYHSEPAAEPYNVYEIDLTNLARHGKLEMNRSRLSFKGAGEWEGAQIPIGAARRRENWSFSRDPQGRLVFSQSFRTAGVFWVIPVLRHAEVRCVLPGSGG